MNHYRLPIIIASAALWLTSGATAAFAAGNISSTDKYAWSETSGWLNFAPSGGGVTVYSDHLEGYAWSENIGWISLGSHIGGGVYSYDNSTKDNWGVNWSGTTLSGYAWSETAGWINFKPTGGGVTLNERSGVMDGYAWGENIGWLRIRNSSPAYGIKFYPTFGVSAIVFNGTTGYAAQDGGGVWKSTDSGATWTAATTQPANQRVKGLVIHPTTTTTLFAASYGNGVYTSTDRGLTWTACAGQPSNLNAVSLAIDSTTSPNLYAGTEAGIFTSTDNCSSWNAVNSGLTVSSSTPPLVIAVDSTTPANLYAGLDGAGIYRSTDKGVTWSAATIQPGNLAVKALVISKIDHSTLYAATYGAGLFKSTDSGDKWSICGNSGLTSLNLKSLVMDGNGKLYAGTEGGVYVSSDACDNWTEMNSGLPTD